jgi:hypothetical protein
MTIGSQMPNRSDPNDPFAAMGGGVNVNGNWVPKDHPLAQQNSYAPQSAAPTQAQMPQAAAATPAAAQTTAAPNPNDPFTAMGGGVQLPGGEWVPKDHPLAATAGAQPGATPAATPGATPAATPGAETPKDVVTQAYLDSIKKGTNVDRNDPNFRMQADAFSGAQERARRNAQDDRAEQAFGAGQRGVGGNLVEQRMIDEGAARNVGAFEADLVGRELTSRRQEIQQALTGLGGMISNDEKMALERELAALDAAIKREGIASGAATAAADISLRDRLGTGALNADLFRALLGNQQAGNQLGFDMGKFDWQRMMDLM